jgi:hypothetical protein
MIVEGVNTNYINFLSYCFLNRLFAMKAIHMLVLLNCLVMNLCCFPVRTEFLNPKHTTQKVSKETHTHNFDVIYSTSLRS